jgi:hypothetical protein
MSRGSILDAVVPYWPAIKIGLVAASYAGSGVVGWEVHNRWVYQPHLAKDAKAVARIEAATRKLEQNATIISTKWRQSLDDRQQETRVVTQTIIRAIPAYLPVPAGDGPRSVGDVRAGGLPNGAVLLHDYAAAGVPAPVPPASGIDLLGPSGVDLSQGLSVISTNYGECHAWRAEVLTWRGWYREQVAKWPSK